MESIHLPVVPYCVFSEALPVVTLADGLDSGSLQTETVCADAGCEVGAAGSSPEALWLPG